MTKRPYRRANFISPFGPGAISVAPDGTAALTAGLDHWYDPPPHENESLYDIREFKFHEWRLERELGLDHLRLPPDYRTSQKGRSPWGEDEYNLKMQVPMLRFPRWHVCTNLKCQTLKEMPMSAREQPKCDHCSKDTGFRHPMIQVQFVAICEHGHIQDFPWRQWVHRTHSPTCNGRLWLFGTGEASLSGRRVKCECGKSRDLNRILGGSGSDVEADSETSTRKSFLSSRLSDDGVGFLCSGLRPWLGETEGRGCGAQLFGSLRGATNVYFANLKSSIYLPLEEDGTSSELARIIARDEVQLTLASIKRYNPDSSITLLRNELKALMPRVFAGKFPDEEIDRAIEQLELGESVASIDEVAGDDPDTSFRRAEYHVLRSSLNHPDLIVESADITKFDHQVSDYFSTVQLVKSLRETRVFTGFSRLISSDTLSRDERIEQLWRYPERQPTNWLPAYNVYGEGIFLEFKEDRLREWEQANEAIARIGALDARYQRLVTERSYSELAISPRFVLLHSFAHLLINQLVYDCGYSSASLRERLYVSDNPDHPMAGLLIYTASGDSDGTMGGLVRMGNPGYLEPVIESAVRNASWCSNDPVCMELGASGQGPDSCNLAACHSCSLLPETSCERFNRFLDRWTVVGSPTEPGQGFFSSLTTVPETA